MKLSRGIFVSTLGLLKLPSSGTTTVHAQVKPGLLQNYQVNGENGSMYFQHKMPVSPELHKEQERTGSFPKWIPESQKGEKEGKVGGDWEGGWLITRNLQHNRILYLSFFRGRKRRGSGRTSVKRLLGRKDLWRKVFSNRQRRLMERWDLLNEAVSKCLLNQNTYGVGIWLCDPHAG